MMKFFERFYKHTSLRQDSLIIFLICTAVYLANQRTNSVGDTIPNSLLAFNWVLKHTLDFDNFRNGYFFDYAKPAFFVEAPNGHLTSFYPIGSAIITFPLYLLFSPLVCLLKILYENGFNISFDINLPVFETYRLVFEKLAATVIASVSVVVFYLISRLNFEKSIAIISTFIYAFASENWMINSQNLWQHGPSNLAVLSIILCLSKANRTEGRFRRVLLFAAGIFCGLLPGIRPSSIFFSIAAVIYSLYTYRQEFIFLASGLLSAILSAAWNLYYFNNIFGYYENISNSLYSFTSQQFIQSFLGLLISPSRGLLIFSPIVLLAIPGMYYILKMRAYRDEKLLICMLAASAALFFSYCFYTVWWAGWSYGPRFMTDILPAVYLSLNYYVRECIGCRRTNGKLVYTNFVLCTFLILLSTFPQLVGAFGTTSWDSVPVSSGNRNRLWRFEDSQIERHAKNLFFQSLKIPFNSLPYLHELQGEILQITDVNNKPITASISAEPGSMVLLKANLKNIGKARWFGYETGIGDGESRVSVQFWNRDNQLVRENRLYVSGMPKEGSTARALGFVHFPDQPGVYRLVFNLLLEGVGQISTQPGQLPYELEARVENQGSPSQISPSPLASRVYAQLIKVPFPPELVKPGSTLNLPISIQNTSNFSWTSTGTNPVNLSYHWIKADGSMEVFDGERTALPFEVPPGSSTALNAKIQVPQQTGTYTLYLSMVEESVAWFDTKGAQPLAIKIKLAY